MRRSFIFLALLTPLLFSACTNKEKQTVENETKTEVTTYLGQKAPGKTPQLFAPDIIRTEHREAEAAWSPDLKEFYFRRRGGQYERNTLVVIKEQDGQWIESLVPPLAGEPFVSTDGESLHLGRKYRDRTNEGWSEVKSLGPMFDNEEYGLMRLTSSVKGTYVFDDYKSKKGIRISEIKDGIRQAPQLMSAAINTGEWIAHPFIAPDESYIIWDAEKENGFGDNDLFISFRENDGSWGSAINLGAEVNSEFADAYGSISPDGKYFFFHRSYGGDTGDIFWVDAEVIFALRSEE